MERTWHDMAGQALHMTAGGRPWAHTHDEEDKDDKDRTSVLWARMRTRDATLHDLAVAGEQLFQFARFGLQDTTQGERGK